MELMGLFAAANHDVIHRKLRHAIGAEVILDVENHHNFAWKETHGGRSVVVHRKGATPAGKGVLGVIPGSMTAPGYLVRGKGEPSSLDSAAHGAGRRMSRTQAKRSIRWAQLREETEAAGVHLISAGLDECPGELVIFDPAKSTFEADGVVQRIPGRGKKVEAVIADRLVDASWPKYLHPFPISNNYFLVSCKTGPKAHSSPT